MKLLNWGNYTELKDIKWFEKYFSITTPLPDSKEVKKCKGYGSSWCANWLWPVPAISLQCCIMDARTLKCKNKQTSERTKNQTNQETNKYTIVQLNKTVLVWLLTWTGCFFKTAAPSPQMTRYLKSQPGLGWMILGRLNVLPYLVLD